MCGWDLTQAITFMKRAHPWAWHGLRLDVRFVLNPLAAHPIQRPGLWLLPHLCESTFQTCERLCNPQNRTATPHVKE